MIITIWQSIRSTNPPIQLRTNVLMMHDILSTIHKNKTKQNKTETIKNYRE